MSVNKIYLLSDNLLELNGLKNGQTDAYENAATVTVMLVDSSGNDVAGETWPITLFYVAASNGIYRATLKDTISLVDGKTYTAKVTADAGADLKRYWETELDAIIGT